jgi:protocatechuate 4,5-dioxygenase alpha chain
MGLDKFDPLLRTNDLVQDLTWDPDLRQRFETHRDDVLVEYNLTDQGRRVIQEEDFLALHEMGLHTYLLSQIARLLVGNPEKAGTSGAATALRRSLLRDDYDAYIAERNE